MKLTQKLLSCALLCQVIFVVPLLGQNLPEWKKKAVDADEVSSSFKEPPLFYAPHTFWFWDAPLDQDQILGMAEEMTRQRLNPGYVHARGNKWGRGSSMPVNQWLTTYWYDAFSGALSRAKGAGMYLGYCDEYMWPSGQAAGFLLDIHPHLRAQSLRWTRTEHTGGQKITLPKALFTVAAKLDQNGRLSSKSLKVLAKNSSYEWKIPSGQWVVFAYDTTFMPGIDGGEVNYLDNTLIDAFIQIAHDGYEARFPNDMGKGIPGVFVDNEGDFGRALAWSDYLAESYQLMNQRDIRLYMPLLTEEDAEGLWPKARYDWFNAVSEVYASQFTGRMSQWLEERNMYYISNLWEESIMLVAEAVGDLMRCQRSVTMPGVDALFMRALDPHDFKETQSVCEFEDRPFMTELMGVAGWEQSPVMMKMCQNALTAWGVTHVVPHGINLNRKLNTIPFPADWFTENPYWNYLHLWNDFVRRSAYVNRQGQLCADVLIYSPLETAWSNSASYFIAKGRHAEWPDGVVRANDLYTSAMRALTDIGTDYLIADRYYLERAVVDPLKPGLISIGSHSFRVLVVPPVSILSENVMLKMEAFADNGGTVIMLGAMPEASAERGLNDPKVAKWFERMASKTGFHNFSADSNPVEAMLSALSGKVSPHIRIKEGVKGIYRAHRKIGDRDFYWIANNTTDTLQNFPVVVAQGSGLAEKWDCETGSVAPLYYKTSEDGISMHLNINPYEGFWLVFDPSKPASQSIYAGSEFQEVLSLPVENWGLSIADKKAVQQTSAALCSSSDPDFVKKYFGGQIDDKQWFTSKITGEWQTVEPWKARALYIETPNTRVYYLKKFELPDKPVLAGISLAADDEHQLFVNGKAVAPGPNAKIWNLTDYYDIAPLLQKGDNTIAVEVLNTGGPGGLFVQGKILGTNTKTEILSDETWLQSSEVDANWPSKPNEAAAWFKAQVADNQTNAERIDLTSPPRVVSLDPVKLYIRLRVPPGKSSLTLPGISNRPAVYTASRQLTIANSTCMFGYGEKELLLVIDPAKGMEKLDTALIFKGEGISTGPRNTFNVLGLSHFTGYVDYQHIFTADSTGQKRWLDLGDVRYTAEVWLNDSLVGAKIWPPFLFDVTGYIRQGQNKLRVRIGNLMTGEMRLYQDLNQINFWGGSGIPQKNAYDAGFFSEIRLLKEKE